MAFQRCRTILAVLAFTALLLPLAPAQEEPQLTADQMKEFLLKAKVIKAKQVGKGVTGISRLTLSDGNVTHDAAFQTIDETKAVMRFADGKIETNFRDSYKYDIAAYELAVLVGLGEMMPVTVQRKYAGKTGALSWWLSVKMDEEKRIKQHINPPDVEAWNRQMYKMRVFSQLVYDTDRNLGNVLITEDWRLYMIDFSRAFRLYTDLENAKNITRCERKLLESLRRLDAGEVEKATGPYLTKMEIKGIMARRDKLVQLVEKLAAEKGEDSVLY